MRIGYSFWGFLGRGILDTPDGGRSHRRVLIDALLAAGHRIVFLQANRDLLEAGHDLTGTYTWDSGLPDIDVLFCEWRWPISGRNTTACGKPGHTCDLHRQRQLITDYTRRRQTPTVLWDKDLRLPLSSALRHIPHVTVCEAALHPRSSAVSLLFPVDDAVLDAADPAALAALPRDLSLVYVGNQYDRDHAFDTFFAPAAPSVPHLVAGKWTRTQRWPHLAFVGRIPFAQVTATYQRSLATVLLLPERYRQVSQMTQRLPEAVLAGCLPLAPADIRDVDRFAPPDLHVTDGTEVITKLRILRDMAGSQRHVDLITGCLRALDPFRMSRQIAVLDELLKHRKKMSV